MIILLVLYFIFLVVYIGFNVYAILKVWSMRLENDHTQTMLVIYMTIISVIILISLIMITGLSWSTKFNFSLN